MTIQEEEKRRPKLKEEKKKKKKNKKKKKAKEFTFVLGLPLVFIRRTVGAVVKEFTKIGLNVIDLRCMSVTRKFIEAHFKKEGRNTFTGPVMEFVNRGPFLAIKLEGDDAVNRAHQLVSTNKEHPLWDYWPLIYSSDSVQSAREDAAMWFCTDSSNWKEEALRRKNLVFTLPDRSICGFSTNEVLEDIIHSSGIYFHLENKYQRFILIRPKAFQNGMMPELLWTIEQNCYSMRGLKLVKKSEAPHSIAWSDNSSSSGETDKEEFGIACIVLPRPFNFDKEGSILFRNQCVSRDLVYVSEEGESLKFVDEFFKFGVVGWMDPTSTDFCGGLFEPTLTGLLFEDDCD